MGQSIPETMLMASLVGRRIDALCVSDDESLLVFETDAGAIAYETDGDCCSETWFADILGVGALLGACVRAVEVRDLPEPEDARSRQEVDKAYGVTLTTDKGYVDIVYRNSSNGYYGGDAYRVSLEGLPNGLRPILADWSA